MSEVLSQEVRNTAAYPPKPPRAHDWKLLVKNIQVTLNQQDNAAGRTCVFFTNHTLQSISDALHVHWADGGCCSLLAGSMNPFCVLQLDDPPQKFNSSVLMNTSHLAWDQPFIL